MFEIFWILILAFHVSLMLIDASLYSSSNYFRSENLKLLFKPINDFLRMRCLMLQAVWENPLALGEDNNLKNYFKFQLLRLSISISFLGFVSRRYLGLRLFKINKLSELKALLTPNKIHSLVLVLVISSEFPESLRRMIVCQNVFSQQQTYTELMKLMVVSWKKFPSH